MLQIFIMLLLPSSGLVAPLLLPSLAAEVVTPAGKLPRECVHGVAHGSRVAHNRETGEIHVWSPSGSDYVITPHPRCRQSGGVGKAEIARRRLSSSGDDSGSFKGGWQAYTKQQIPEWTSFSGSWNVPSAPASCRFRAEREQTLVRHSQRPRSHAPVPSLRSSPLTR